MKRQHPDHRMDIPISLKVHQQLVGASCNTGFEKEDWEIAAEAIDEWMRRHSPNSLPMPATNGYQWKRLFLPNGTLLRTVFGGKNYHCIVEGDAIVYDGRPVSPSGFANEVGGTRRNAWKCIWILFPDTKDWRLADTLRTRERPHRTRRQASAVSNDLAHRHAPASTPVPVPPNAFAPVSATSGSASFDRATSGTGMSATGMCDIRTSSKVSPAPVAPSTPASASQPEGCALCAARTLQQALHAHVQAPDASGGGRRRHLRANPRSSPPGIMCGMDRRANGNDQMTALLRHELLPLLQRICAPNAPRAEPRAPHGT